MKTTSRAKICLSGTSSTANGDQNKMAILFEDGFETGDLSKWDGVIETNGTVAIGERATPDDVLGRYFLIGDISAGGSNYRACVTKAVSVALVHARAYVSVEQGVPENGLTLISTVCANGMTPGVIRARNIDGVDQLEVAYQDSTGGYHSVAFSPPTNLVPGTTYLLELMVKPGAGDGEIRAWVGENEVVTLTGLDMNHGLVTELRFGAVVLLGTGGAIVYADACAIGDSYIGPAEPTGPFRDILDGVSDAEGLIYAGDINWTDYTVETPVRMMGDSYNPEVAVVVRYNDADNFYWAGLGCWTHRVSISRMVNGTSEELVFAGSNTELVTDRTYMLKVVVKGDLIQLYVDGNLELEIHDSTFPNGAIGYRIYHGHMEADWIKAYAPTAFPIMPLLILGAATILVLTT